MNAFQQSLLIFSLLIVAFILFFMLNFTFFKNVHHLSFNLKNMFPYELNNYNSRRNPYFLPLLIICLALTVASFSPLIYHLTYSEIDTAFTWFVFVIALAFTLAQTSFVLLCLIPAVHIKPHAIISTIFFSLSLLSSAVLAVAFYNLYVINQENYYIVFMVLAICIAVFDAILIVNPKLKYWANLERNVDKDGTITYVRPKIFVLALSEWLIFISNIGVAILLLVIGLII
jgi:hypothetical protein